MCARARVFVCLFIRSFIHSFVRSFVCLFVHSFIHLFVRSFVRSFIRSCVCVCVCVCVRVCERACVRASCVRVSVLSDRVNKCRLLRARAKHDYLMVRKCCVFCQRSAVTDNTMNEGDQLRSRRMIAITGATLSTHSVALNTNPWLCAIILLLQVLAEAFIALHSNFNILWDCQILLNVPLVGLK